jgi:hypothetical protein
LALLDLGFAATSSGDGTIGLRFTGSNRFPVLVP